MRKLCPLSCCDAGLAAGPARASSSDQRVATVYSRWLAVYALTVAGTHRALVWEHSARARDALLPRRLVMNLLWALAVILLVMWALGFGVYHVTGGLIHLLLVLAVIAVVVRLISGRRV